MADATLFTGHGTPSFPFLASLSFARSVARYPPSVSVFCHFLAMLWVRGSYSSMLVTENRAPGAVNCVISSRVYPGCVASGSGIAAASRVSPQLKCCQRDARYVASRFWVPLFIKDFRCLLLAHATGSQSAIECRLLLSNKKTRTGRRRRCRKDSRSPKKVYPLVAQVHSGPLEKLPKAKHRDTGTTGDSCSGGSIPNGSSPSPGYVLKGLCAPGAFEALNSI